MNANLISHTTHSTLNRIRWSYGRDIPAQLACEKLSFEPPGCTPDDLAANTFWQVVIEHCNALALIQADFDPARFVSRLPETFDVNAW